MSVPTLLTSALPYANGSIHMGHLVEYIQTDIYARYLRSVGEDVIYLCADDTHGTPIELKARSLGIDPAELVAKYGHEHLQDFTDFHIAFDAYYSTNSPENRHYAETIYHRLKDKGHIHTAPLEHTYCENCARFLPDRYIRGICPKCRAQDQYGDVCEACNSTYSPEDLIEPRCAVCGATPVKRTSLHYFFKLSSFAEPIREWVMTPGRLQPEILRFVGTWLEEGLRDWDISRDGPYFGFKIPGEDDKYFYVWLDAPVGYIATTDRYCQISGRDFNRYWNNPEARIIHVIGKDIVYFHTLFWPAMLMGAEFTLPSQVQVHGMLTINGEKMSKARGTFINARAYLDHLDPQYLRFYYASKLSSRPDDLDLSFEDFINRVNADLVNNIANLASRVVPFVTRNLDGRLGDLDPGASGLVEEVKALARDVGRAYGEWEFGRAVRGICLIADRFNKYVQESAPWALQKTDIERARAVCTTAANGCRTIAALIAPVLPQLAEDLRRILRTEPLMFEHAQAFDLKNREIGPFTKLVERVLPERVKALQEASVATVTPAAPPQPVLEPFKPEIEIADLERMDLRVARVLEAQEVEGADKLLRLLVDLGLEKRTILAGIRQAYTPQSLVGRLVVVVANLKPRKMRFGVSEGMVLASGPGGKDVFLLEVGEGAQVGDRIH